MICYYQGTSSKVTLVETPALQEIKDRLDLSEDLRPPTPGHLTTLRVKSELGDQMYVLKMKYTETIGDVKTLINKLRSISLCQVTCIASFPGHSQLFSEK